MPPQTAILGWGSLLWEGGAEFDQWHDDWRYDGPSLKLEFSRVSSTRSGALTIVIDPKHGAANKVAWCLSKRNEPDSAVADLCRREKCPIRYIACLSVAAFSDDQPTGYEGAKEIADWARARELDVVVWTTLSSNFDTKVKKPFSVQEAISYLKGLPAPIYGKAAEYIRRTPEFVCTPLRQAVEQDQWFHEQESS